MVGDADFLGHFGAVLIDILLCLDTMIFEELAHDIEVLHRNHIVIGIVEEHDVEVAAGCPAAGEGIRAKGGLEASREWAAVVEHGCGADVSRLLGLDEFQVEGHALVLFAEKPLVEVAGHGIL